MSANTLAQIPDTDHSGVVTADELALVGVDNNIVDGGTVDIVALEATGTCIPDLHGSILGASDHPFALAVEGNTGDIVRVTLESNHRVRVGRLDVEQLDIVMAGGREESLVRSDAQAIDLGVRVLNGTRANTGERFPEAVRDNISASPATDCDVCSRQESVCAVAELQLTGWYDHTPL